MSYYPEKDEESWFSVLSDSNADGVCYHAVRMLKQRIHELRDAVKREGAETPEGFGWFDCDDGASVELAPQSRGYVRLTARVQGSEGPTSVVIIIPVEAARALGEWVVKQTRTQG
jgi:hypothetical protein